MSVHKPDCFLPRGIYALDRTVKNPNSDARVTKDWRRMPFEPGHYHVGVEEVVVDDRVFRYNVITRVNTKRTQALTSGDDAGATLLNALNPRKTTVQTILEETGLDNCHPTFYRRVLGKLVDAGKLSLDDVLKTLHEVDEEMGN